MILPFRGRTPRIHRTAFIAPGAHVIGEVAVGEGASVWFNAVLRGDLARIRVGRLSNVQDGCVVHVDRGVPCAIGEGVTVGHQATVHACAIGDGALVGIGATVLSGARVGAYSLIGAGAVVLEGVRIPERSLVLGVPGKVVRRLSDREAATHVPHARRYRALADEYRRRLG
jgi:carbonic anhydrase/acetyltransferase-like protein (isoleucine patch superfamily)